MARLTKRGDSFVVDYYRDGKRVRKAFKDEHTATYVLNQLLMQELKKEMGVAVDQPIKEVKINEAIRQYYKTRSEGKASAKTEKCYFERFYQFIHEEKGLSYLSEIDYFHIEEYQQKRARQIKASSVNREFHTLSSFFNRCVEWAWIQKSPVKVKALKEFPNPYAQWNEDQIEMMVQCLPAWASQLFWFIAQTGCRPCEARHLKWEDVLFSQRLLRLKSQKTSQGMRYIPVSDSMIQFLGGLSPRPTGYVFSFDGGQVSKDHLEKTVKKTREEVGLASGLSLYGLRHGYATKLAAHDVNENKIRRLLGHTSVKTTQRYINMKLDDLREAAEIGAPKLKLVHSR